MRNNLKLIATLIVLHLLSIHANSQEIKKTLFGFFKEKYSVSADNKEIKDGSYAVLVNKKAVIQGKYSNNQRCGLWTLYSFKQDIEYVYDYDSHEFKYWKCQDEFQTCNDKKRPAYYSDGFYLLSAKIATKIKYTYTEAMDGAQGSTKVNIQIDEAGRFNDCYLLQSSGFLDIDKQAVVAVRNICSNSIWLPAIDNNDKPIVDNITITVDFYFQ